MSSFVSRVDSGTAVLVACLGFLCHLLAVIGLLVCCLVALAVLLCIPLLGLTKVREGYAEVQKKHREKEALEKAKDEDGGKKETR